MAIRVRKAENAPAPPDAAKIAIELAKAEKAKIAETDAARKKQFHHDLFVLQAHMSSPDSVIQDLTHDGEFTLNFKLILPSLDKIRLSLIVPEDYPKGEYMLVVPSDGLRFSAGNEVKTLGVRGTLCEVFCGLQEEYWRPSVAARAAAVARNILRSSGRYETDLMPKIIFEHQGLKRSGLKSSRGPSLSNSEGGSVDDDDENFDDNDEYFGGEQAPWEISKKQSANNTIDITEEDRDAIMARLVSDVAAAKKAGIEMGIHVDTVTMEYLARVVVPLPDFLDQFTAQAWGVMLGQAIVVELVFTARYLSDSRQPPKVVNIVQTAAKDLDVRTLTPVQDFGLRWFMLDRLQDVLRRNWIKYYRSPTEAAPATRSSSVSLVPITTGNAARDATNSALLKVMTQGFGKAVSEIALDEVKGDADKALEWLRVPGNLTIAESKAEGQKLAEASMAGEPLYSGMAGLSPAQIEVAENLFAGNFFVKIVEYLNLRLRTCPSVCVICDAPLPYVGLKPSVCPKQLCNHSFEAYGLGFSLIGELKHNQAVTDLLITMTVACCRNKRNNGADVFSPYPDMVSVDRKDNFGKVVQSFSFMEGKKKRTDLVEATCKKLPQVKDIAALPDEKALKLYLDGLDPLVFPLLRWIVMSNRCHLTPLPADKHVKEMPTPHQYVLISDSPEKNARFNAMRYYSLPVVCGKGSDCLNIEGYFNLTICREAQAKITGGRGSFFAFHGSAIGNWHCILRMGLRNYSNTDKMSAGAACGPGIYFAEHAATSAGYMVAGQGWEKSSIATGVLSCIAICEIIDKRKEGKPGGVNVHNQIFVVEKDELVCTRFFFVFSGGSPLAGKQIAANTIKLPEEIFKKP